MLELNMKDQEKQEMENQMNQEICFQFASMVRTMCQETVDLLESNLFTAYVYFAIKFDYLRFSNRLALKFLTEGGTE